MSMLGDEARKAEESGNYEEALRLWSQLAHKSGKAIDCCLAGRAAYTLARWSESEEFFKWALNIDRSCGEAMAGLGLLFRERKDGERRANLLEAKGWLVRALRIDRSATRFTLLGCTYGQLGDKAAATEAFKDALAVNPRWEEAYLNLALLNIDEDPQAARTYLEKAIELDPNYAEAFFELGMLSQKHSPHDAIEMFEKVVEIDPDFGDAHQKIGNLLHKEKSLTEAEYHFRRCLEIDAQDYFSHLYLANCLSDQGREKEAESLIRAALDLEQEDGFGHEFFANFLDLASRVEEANEIRVRKPLEAKFQTRAASHIAAIETWMHTITANGGVTRGDGLVLDNIDDTWTNSYLWIPTALYAYELALKIRDQNKLPYSDAIRFSLEPGHERQGVNFETRKQLSLERSKVQPTFYLVTSDHEPWAQTDEENERAGIAEMMVEKINPALLATAAQIKGCYYVEYRNKGVIEYSRSVFVTG